MALTLRWSIALLFTVAILLVTGVATAVGIAIGSQEIEKSIVENQRRSGEGSANGLEFYLESAGRSLVSVSTLIDRRQVQPTVDEQGVGALFDPLIAYSQEFTSVLLVDAEGEPVLARPLSSPSSLSTFGDHEAFEAVQKEGVGALSLDPMAGPAYWVVPVLSTRETQDPHYVVGVLNPFRMQDILVSNVAAGTDAALLTDQGLVLTATDPDLVPGRHLTGGGQGVVSVHSVGRPVEDRDVIATLSQLPTHPATVLVMTPMSEVTSLQGQLVRNALIIFASLTATGVILGVVAASRITRPIDHIRETTHRMRVGELDVRARLSGAQEIQDLAMDFNAMADTLSHDRRELLQLQKNLEGLVEARTAQVEEQRDQMELFFYGVSHDFKSPVLAISTFAQLAEEAMAGRRLKRAEIEDFVGRIRRSASNLEKLITQLLEFARAGGVEPEYSSVVAHDVLAGVVDEARPQARRRGIELEARGPRVRITTDANRLRQIVTNLVENAIKYMPKEKESPRVDVRWHRSGGEFVVEVADNGAGIPEDSHELLFQPFHRSHQDAPGHSGSGLGLSIVHRLVESLKGRVDVVSHDGRGATFRVHLPLAVEATG